MTSKRFSIKEAFAYAWEAFKNNIGFFIGLVLVTGAVNVAASFLINSLSLRGTPIWYVLQLVGMILRFAVSAVIARFSLDIYDTGRPDLSKIGETLQLLVPYCANQLIYLILVAVGFALLLVPGLIVLPMFYMASFLIIDRRMGPIEALQESRVVTSGAKLDLLLLLLLQSAVIVLGALCVLIGLLVAIPIAMMSSVYVYRQLCPAVSTAVAPATIS